jgi:hypothetical protein
MKTLKAFVRTDKKTKIQAVALFIFELCMVFVAIHPLNR